jgi:hypothetical protein
MCHNDVCVRDHSSSRSARTIGDPVVALFDDLVALLRPRRVMVEPADALPGLSSPGHAEVVLVVFDRPSSPSRSCSAGSGKVTTRRRACVKAYRSAILATDDAQLRQAQSGAAAYGRELAAAGFGDITTEIAPLQRFYHAEDYHQQYLAKNPNGYCGLGGTGVSCPVGRDS